MKLLVPEHRVLGFDAPDDSDADGRVLSPSSSPERGDWLQSPEPVDELVFRSLYIASDYKAIAARTKKKWSADCKARRRCLKSRAIELLSWLRAGRPRLQKFERIC